jgi:hypothetical protein
VGRGRFVPQRERERDRVLECHGDSSTHMFTACLLCVLTLSFFHARFLDFDRDQISFRR